MPKVECQWRWEHGVGCEYPDVNLPTGWHLNTERVPVPPPPKGAALQVEAERRRRNLPPTMRRRPVYRRLAYWAAFLAWEHEARRASAFRGEIQPEEEDEEDDEDDFDAEEPAPPSPPLVDHRAAELMPAGISEEDALRMALEESAHTDDGRYVRELEDAIELSAAVAAHGPPPPAPPLPWWAPVDAPRDGYVPPPPAWYNPERAAAFCAATGWGTEVRGWSPPPPPHRAPSPPPHHQAPQQQAQATWPEGVPWVPPPFVDLTKDGSDTSDVDDLADFNWTR